EAWLGPDPRSHFVAAEHGQPQVAQDHFGHELAGQPEPVGARMGHGHAMTLELQHRAQRFRSVLAVFDEQYLHRARPFLRVVPRLYRTTRDVEPRELDRKLRAATGSLAVGRDAAAMQVDQRPNQGKAETEAAATASQLGVSLYERREELRHQGRLDADSAVGDP